MPNVTRLPDELNLIPDFAYESRHEFLEKVAYKFWESRGRPVGSPEVDWKAAEQAVYAKLVAENLIKPTPDGPAALGDSPPPRAR
jgi:hypothetical protein